MVKEEYKKVLLTEPKAQTTSISPFRNVSTVMGRNRRGSGSRV